tara:strand:- start:742 stop:978 length:237 start_codon:yes stop_codon:yes gene_type:complete
MLVIAAFFIWLITGVVCAGVAGSVASAKRWNMSSWALLGFFFGPIAVIGAAGMPDKVLRRTTRLIAEERGIEVNPPKS